MFCFQIYQDLKSRQISETFKKIVSRRDGIRSFGGTSGISSEGTQHSYAGEGQQALCVFACLCVSVCVSEEFYRTGERFLCA